MQQFLDFVIRHWELCLAFMVILGLILHFETANQVSGIRLLSPQEVTQLINHEQAIIVDVRVDADYKAGHIINAISLPADIALEKVGKLQKYKSKPIIVVDQMGQQAHVIGSKLKKTGFEKLFALKGGLQSWQNANLPLTTS